MNNRCHPEPCPEFISGLIQCSHPELDSGSNHNALTLTIISPLRGLNDVVMKIICSDPTKDLTYHPIH
ncbi:MAG: hypothetical protein AB1444_12540 [Spirochaetota bacterium]